MPVRRLLAVIALVAGVLSPATSVSGALGASGGHHQRGLGIRLVDVPVATADDPRALVYIIDHVAPGALIERRIEVSNRTGAATLRASVPSGGLL